MNSSDLPEDYKLWPSDPYKLFNVPVGADPKEVKRAYTRLIKQFKPEHFPEQFRLLREAFDQINNNTTSWDREREIQSSRFLANKTRSRPNERDEQDSDEINSSELSGSKPSGSQSGASPSGTFTGRIRNDEQPFSKHAYEDPTKRLWELAKSDGIESALDAIRESAWPEDLKTKICLIEYWLRKTKSPNPNSDEAARCLLENLHRFLDLPTAMNVARTELIAHPGLSSAIDLNKCFRKGNSLYNLSELLRIRWEAACQIHDHQQILLDYQLFSERYFERRDTWDGVTITAINFLMWSTDPEVRIRCDEILSNLELDSGLRSSFEEYLTQIDYLKQIILEFQKVNAERPEWHPLLNLVPSMWNGIDPLYANRAAAWLVQTSKDISYFMTVFDGLAKDSPRLLNFIKSSLSRVINIYTSNNDEDCWERLGQQNSDTVKSPIDTRVSESIRRFLTTADNRSFEKSRERLLRFCLDKQIKIDWVVEYISSTKDKVAFLFRGQFVKDLESDVSLKAIHELMMRLELASC
ncbi:MAG: J domain-containing protein [Planctomycetota bacterium]|nr:J domain-containing protein [Planctomycetota bacterium]